MGDSPYGHREGFARRTRPALHYAVMLAVNDLVFGLFKTHSVALTVLVLSIVAACGLALGSIKIRGLHLGIGGVLFAGLAMGRWIGHDAFDAEILDFARDFGLILFVYTIGVQVGPGFLASLRKQGLPLNSAAFAVVLLGVLLTIGVSRIGGIEMRHAVGLFSGGTTNTPSLAAAQQALTEVKNVDATGTVAAYAIAYPFGVIGIIVIMVLVRVIFRVDVKSEVEALMREEGEATALITRALEVTNPNLDGLQVRRVPGLGGEVFISRVMHANEIKVAGGETVVHMGDVLLAVGPAAKLDAVQLVIGRRSNVDLTTVPSGITARRLLVTRSEALGKTVAELNLQHRYGVTITRIRRGDVELPPGPAVRLQFADTAMAVGEESAVKQVASELGDSLRRLNHPQVIPIFVGIALGVILGSVPFRLPGMPAAVKLGMAGGPLIVAIVLSRLGHVGPLVWHLPVSANFALREMGIVLFLASMGVKSGGQFFDTLLHGPGLYWMACGALITALPLIVVALFARVVMKMNYTTLCGLLAGSMTDPPALQFAGSITGSDAPSISYAAVYPLVMVLRVVAAQILILMS
jgi:putative transport protein